ncbi:hypothetical protein C3941_14775 [Kaistia algarum]|uniref:hypothetical protein n=1 Tax=Kaistia algarum TaxID=2083279 RepID=UPI000CE878D8|nr:hypothetical protein [Kaistia algarum]MCX5514335.1 hypothetical protein [Kaistia algarum]PPE79088.1 hypothetical protein C3941_14775 [Kaistia algarum]
MKSLIVAGSLAAGLLCGPAFAADIAEVPAAPMESAPTNDWRFQATIYGWLSGVNGDVGAKGLGPFGIDVTPIDAIQNLDGAVMASFAAQNDQWLILTDFMWTQISTDKTIGTTGINYSQDQITVQGALGYTLPINIERLKVSATVGFRYQNLSADLSAGPVYSSVWKSASGSEQWIDPTVGVYAHYDFNDKWFINALGDVGGFGVGSNLTWQAFGALGYNWTKTISTSIGYRAIYEDYENGGFVYNTTQQGVFAGLGIHF